ncbi:MAG: phenylalanine--tRNA ligase subunit beta [Clostridiales bacterium]|nr:phenylalanine--tRNA ligase subunit beta [Clostridiales bacterium]
MKLPLKWLKEYVDFTVTPEEFSERMLLRGFEVAEIIPEMDGIDGVYVCEITAIEPHPNADKLRVCMVDVGRAEPLQIVTNAVNVKVGDQVPVALDNATLTGGLVIHPTKMRGVASAGMFCGNEELGITNVEYPGCENGGVMVFAEPHPNGQRIQEALDLDDCIFDIELTPNRPDCQSIIGICREAAAALGKPFSEPVPEVVTGYGDCRDVAQVTVENPYLCPRYCARVVTDLKIEPSPLWMQRKLRAVGMRPINNIVDITNLVLVEYGHPMHAFDLACVAENHIVVRNAKQDEVVYTLDGKERVMSSDMLLIADPVKGVGVAGVMGGLNSEITPETKATLFESAVFRPENIRSTARKLRHVTDSAARFIKGVEPVNAELALNRAIELVEELHAGRVMGGMIDVCSADLMEKEVDASVSHINEILNTNLSSGKMVELLGSINIPAEAVCDTLRIKVPHFRTDIEKGIETDWDIAEEVGRLYGYTNIAPTLMRGDTFRGRVGESFRDEDRIKDTMAALGCLELYNYNFISPAELDSLMLEEDDERRKTVRLMNPFGEDQSLMRTELAGGLLRAAALNLNRKTGFGRFFEVGNVHFDNADLPEERKLLGVIHFGQDEDFFTLKGTLEELFEKLGLEDVRFEKGGSPYLHPTQKAVITVSGEKLGEIGAVHPKVRRAFEVSAEAYIAELDFAALRRHIARQKKYKPLPKYPAVQRDLALIVDDGMEAQQVIDVIASAKARVLVENVRVFDVYRPKLPGDKGIPFGKKSMAFTFQLRSDDHTLTDEEIGQAVNAILKSLKFRLGAELRA